MFLVFLNLFVSILNYFIWDFQGTAFNLWVSGLSFGVFLYLVIDCCE